MARKGFTQYGANQIVGRQIPMKTNEPKPPPPVVPPFRGIPTMWSPDFSADTAAAKQSALAANSFVADDFTDEDEDGDYIIDDPTKTSGGQTTAQRLARQDAIAGAKGSLTYLQQLLAGAGDKYAPLIAQIDTNKTALEGTADTNYKTALAALAGRVSAANTETTTNYDALRDRLTAAAPRAYANLPAAQAPTLSQDAVSAYAQAIGAPTQAIGQAAVQAAAPYAGTADAYNRLIKNLKANEAEGQASRLAGVDMGRQATTNQINAQNLSSTNALDIQKNTALAQILQAIQGQQLGVSQQQLAYEQSLRQALASIYGTGYVTPPLFGAK